MYYIVKFKANGCWFAAKQIIHHKCGTSDAKIIHFDSEKEAEQTVRKYKNLGYETKVVKKEIENLKNNT